MNGAATLYEPMHRTPEIGIVREGMLKWTTTAQ